MRRAFDHVTETVAKPDADPAELLGALASVRRARSDLDALERGLIAAARSGGASWAAIADALALGSRQAAEQRYLRLSGADAAGGGAVRDTRRRRRQLDRQRKVDTKAIRRLRDAALAVYAAMTARPLKPPENLARATLEHALSAEPGALFALVEQAVADLDEAGVGGWEAAGLRRALEAARSAANGDG